VEVGRVRRRPWPSRSLFGFVLPQVRGCLGSERGIHEERAVRPVGDDRVRNPDRGQNESALLAFRTARRPENFYFDRVHLSPDPHAWWRTPPRDASIPACAILRGSTG